MVEAIGDDKLQACDCGPHRHREPHGCPYREDVNNDFETLCTCCELCTEECASDI